MTNRGSQRLLHEALRHVPHGIWGHQRFHTAVEHEVYPYFIEHAEGSHFVDVDGRTFIDYVCAFGSMVVGYGNPRVEAAVTAERRRGGLASLPSPVVATLAARLCATIEGADWAVLGKSGSDATQLAVLTARAHTGRRRLVCIAGSYHTSHLWGAWCNPGDGRSPADAADVTQVRWNDVEGLRAAFEREGEPIAALVLTPFHHPIPGDAELGAPGFFAAARQLCSEHGSVLVLDDVRAGFRLHPRGSHVWAGIEPDLVCFAKALGNTHAIAALVGGEALRGAVERVFCTGTFWNEGVAMAAAIATLGELERLDAVAWMQARGQQLGEGLSALGTRLGLPLQVTGPAAAPTLGFRGDPEHVRMRRFTAEMAREGSYLHPTHNLFVSAAHSEQDIETTLAHARRALACVR